MSLDLVNNIINGLAENEFIQNFIEELSNCLSNNTNNKSISSINGWINLLSNNLTICDKKIITKYRDIMLQKRREILQNYAHETEDSGQMLYVYNKNNNVYNLINCSSGQSNNTISKNIDEVPGGTDLGSVLRIKEGSLILDEKSTRLISEKINLMIKEQINEQENYLSSKRIDGHTYKVGEKYSGRIWLYDLDNSVNGCLDGIEEIDFSENLYNTVQEGDLLIYSNGEYHIKY